MITSNGHKIRALRQKRRETIGQVANATNISPSALGMYERGMRNPDTKVLLKLAKYFNVELNYFMEISQADIKIIEENVLNSEIQSIALNYVKKRANGNCELCGQRAPFNLNDGTPYLELYEVNKNRGIEKNNIVLLCPNCNKKMEILHLQGDRNFLKQLITKEEI